MHELLKAAQNIGLNVPITDRTQPNSSTAGMPLDKPKKWTVPLLGNTTNKQSTIPKQPTISGCPTGANEEQTVMTDSTRQLKIAADELTSQSPEAKAGVVSTAPGAKSQQSLGNAITSGAKSLWNSAKGLLNSGTQTPAPSPAATPNPYGQLSPSDALYNMPGGSNAPPMRNFENLPAMSEAARALYMSGNKGVFAANNYKNPFSAQADARMKARISTSPDWERTPGGGWHRKSTPAEVNQAFSQANAPNPVVPPGGYTPNDYGTVNYTGNKAIQPAANKPALPAKPVQPPVPGVVQQPKWQMHTPHLDASVARTQAGKAISPTPGVVQQPRATISTPHLDASVARTRAGKAIRPEDYQF